MHYFEGPVTTRGEKIHDLNKGPLYFCDNSYIRGATGIERIWYAPEKRKAPVMTASPWEGNEKYQCVGGFSGQAIVPYQGRLLMFYSVYRMHDVNNEYREFAVAESDDGIKWSKPKLKTGNNFLIHNEYHKYPYWELQNVMFDPHSERFIGMGHCSMDGKTGHVFYAWTKDPFDWDRKNFKKMYDYEDIHSMLGWDEDYKLYVSYPRIERYNMGSKNRIRSIGLSSSRNFQKWSKPIICYPSHSLAPEQIYNMPVSKYGPYYLGLPIVYKPSEENVGPLHTRLSISPNGINWIDKIEGFIDRGRPGEWDDCYAMSASPVEWNNQLMFFYWGCNFPHDDGFRQEKVHKGSVGLATLPKDGLCSLACPRNKPGTVYLEVKNGPVKVEYRGKIKVSGITFLKIELQDAEIFSVRKG